ncbi:MAG: hypothetical protein K2W95_26300 [Candidatus Obscuribacterales bacterium]|nr:hypothetical protein [Candidatus Obscuribacterales bacterium]
MQGKTDRLKCNKIGVRSGRVLVIALLAFTCFWPASTFADPNGVDAGTLQPLPTELKGPLPSTNQFGDGALEQSKEKSKKGKRERPGKGEKNAKKEKKQKLENTDKTAADKDEKPKKEKKLKTERERKEKDEAGSAGGGADKKNDEGKASSDKRGGSNRGSDADISARAREALDKYYSGGLLPIESIVKDIKSGEAQQARSAALFLEALLHQAMDDEVSTSRRRATSAPYWARPLSSTAIDARGAVHGAIFRVGPSVNCVSLLGPLGDDMLPSADGAAALIVNEVSGPDVVPHYTRLLNRPGSSALTTAAVLRKIGKDKLQQFAPKVKEMTGHYRTSVRQAAVDAAGALGIGDIPPYNMQESVTPWLASQISEIGSIKDEQDKLADLKNGPAMNSTVAAAFEYLHGDKSKGLSAIMQKINSIPDDRLLFPQTRDDVFIDYYKLAVKAFIDGQYKDAERIGLFLTSPVFSSSPMAGAPKELVAQLADRSTDFQAFSLPTESAWQDMQKRLPVKEQVEFLVPRLRLVKGQLERKPHIGNVTVVNLDVKQTDPASGNTVINPLSELRKLTADPANLPWMFPFINDRHFLLASFENPGLLPRLQSVGETVKTLINEALQYQMLGREFSALSAGEQQAFLAKQEKWCRKNAKSTGLELSFAIADSTDDERAFSQHVFRLQEAKDNRLGSLLSRRWNDFPSSTERNAEFLFRSGGPVAVKRAEAELKNSPATAIHRSSESPVQWAAAERPAATRFWLALLLVKENNPLGLTELRRMSKLPADQISFVMREHLALLVEVLLLNKTPEKLELADNLVDKLKGFVAPESEQVIESTKRLFLAGSKASYDRILSWINSEPMQSYVVEKLAQWVYSQPIKRYSASELKTLVPDLKAKLQAEYELYAAGKPGSLNAGSDQGKPKTPDPLNKAN